MIHDTPSNDNRADEKTNNEKSRNNDNYDDENENSDIDNDLKMDTIANPVLPSPPNHCDQNNYDCSKIDSLTFKLFLFVFYSLFHELSHC